MTSDVGKFLEDARTGERYLIICEDVLDYVCFYPDNSTGNGFLMKHNLPNNFRIVEHG